MANHNVPVKEVRKAAKTIAALKGIFLNMDVFCTSLASDLSLDGIVSYGASNLPKLGPSPIALDELKNGHKGLIFLPFFVT